MAYSRGQFGVDTSKVSRFRAGKEGLTLKQIEALIKMSDYILAHREAHNDLVRALATSASLLQEKIRFKKRSADATD